MAEKEDKQPDPLIPVGPGAEDLRDESDERAEDDETRGQQAEGEGEEDDERLSHEDDEDDRGNVDDREQIRRRRRAEKARRKENRNRDRVELNFLRQRNETLERRQSEMDARISQGELVMVDNRISDLDSQIAEAERLKAMALSKNDGQSVIEADRIIRDLQSGRNQLNAVKVQRTNAVQARQQAPQTPPEIQMRAREWAEDHSWYDPNLRTPDSRVAHAIEQSLAQDGRFDPRTDDYWDELDRRLTKYLPHRFGKNGNGKVRDEEDDEDEREDVREERRPRGPQVRVGGRERPLRKNEVYVSPERREAMKEAGVWDDAKLRDRYLRRYQEYDREHRRR